MDFDDAPFMYVVEIGGGVCEARLRDGAILRYQVPSFAKVILPSVATAERYAAYARQLEEKRVRIERRARAVAMRLDSPGVTIKAIAAAVGASPSSVSRWIRQAA